MAAMICLQVIPDRTVRNYNAAIIPKALAEFYIRPIDRIDWARRQLKNMVRLAFRTVISPEKIVFYYVVPDHLQDFFKQKILATWDKVTVKPGEIDLVTSLSTNHTRAAELTYRRHDIFSLATDRDSNAPMPSLFTITTDMLPGDAALIDILLEPYSRIEWEYSASRAYEKLQKGWMPRRFELSRSNIAGLVPAAVNMAMTSIQGQLIEVTGGNKKILSREYDMEAKLLNTNGLTEATRQKPYGPAVKAHIRILAQSESPERRGVMLQALAGAFKDISGDNELVRREVVGSRNVETVIKSIASCSAPPWKPANILSCHEAGKFIQLPTAGLQDEFPQIESIGQREVLLPAELFAGGIAIGKVTRGGVTKMAYIPTRDHNILCLPHISLGGMGTGKTVQDAVVALGFLLNGFSAVAIDVADGKLIDIIRDGLPADFPEDHIIDLDFGNLEYPIPLNWSEIARGLATNSKSMDARKAGNRLTAQLIHFINQLSDDQEASVRMESYLSAAGKAVLSGPENGLLEVILCLTSPEYRRGLLAKGVPNMQAADTLRSLNAASDNMQRSIVDPILSRLNLVLGNEAMANCLLQQGNPEIDFRKWLDGDRVEDGQSVKHIPYFIGLRVPKDELLDIATDRLVAFLIAKAWLSVLSRYDTPEEARRPCVMVMDEPHQFMSSKDLWGDMVREARKWRLKLYWSAHNFRDFKGLTKTMKDAGCQYSVFRSSKETYSDLLEELHPFEMEDLLRIPDRYYAVNKLVLPGAANTPAFLAAMVSPPQRIKDRGQRRVECSKLFGRHVDDVEVDIYRRRHI